MTNYEKCLFKLFNENKNNDKELFQRLRFSTTIFVKKVDGLKLEDGQMTVNYDEDIMEEDNILENMKLIGKITPLINYGNYEFYIDKDGIMREKE
uniref:Translationally-controlled tumor protein homolog n=1 Tax=Meloidogyne floridensis TaxID=298350 RepID=A0A915NXH7_9BILA